MIGAASGIILGLLLSTAYAALFHLIMGGPARRLILYLFASWIGFALGHIIGFWLNINFLRLGAIYLMTASLGSWIALLSSQWLGILTPVVNSPDANPESGND